MEQSKVGSVKGLVVVHVIEKYTQKSRAHVPVNFNSFEVEPSVDEIINEAWRRVTDDGTLPADADRLDYLFQVLP